MQIQQRLARYDHAYFVAHPDRNHRVRRAMKVEVKDWELMWGSVQGLPQGCSFYVALRWEGTRMISKILIGFRDCDAPAYDVPEDLAAEWYAQLAADIAASASTGVPH